MTRYLAFLRLPAVLSVALLVTVATLRAVTVTLTVPQATVKPGDTVSVPVSISSAAGLSSIRIQINYDPTLLTLKGVTNDPLGANFRLSAKTNAGTISLLFVRSSDLASGSGKLAELLISPKAGAAMGAFSDLSVARFDIGNSSGVIDLKAGGNLTAPRGRVMVASATAVATPTATPTATGNTKPNLGAFTIPVKTFGDPQFALKAPKSSSKGAFRYESLNLNVATLTGNQVRIIGAGTVTIKATQAALGKYDAGVISANLIVNPAPQKVYFTNSPSVIPYGQAITLSAKASSGLEITSYRSSNEAIASVSGTMLMPKIKGQVTIWAFQSGNENYKSASNSWIFKVASPQTIQFTNLTSPIEYSLGKQFKLVASASSGLPVSFTSSLPGVAAIKNPKVITIKGAGVTTITAMQLGNVTYAPASPVSLALSVTKAQQTIDMPMITNRTFSSTPFKIVAPTAKSGMPVKMDLSPRSVATLSGNKVTMKGAGTATLTAIQDGNSNYQAVTNSTTFVIYPKN